MISYKLPSAGTFRGRYLIAVSILAGVPGFLYLLSLGSYPIPSRYFTRPNEQPLSSKDWARPNDSVSPVSCVGPRGKALHGSDDDKLRSVRPGNVTYPDPISGSYEALSIAKEWYSSDGRYGPYGLGEEDEGYGRKKVEWEKVRWGALQEQCSAANTDRAPHLVSLAGGRRFAYRTSSWEEDIHEKGTSKASIIPRPASEKTGRQAIVVRTWSTYPYTPDDYHNLRSIITEASLAKSGDYNVFLLVDVKDLSLNIHEDAANYTAELNRAVPEEFRDMAVLFDVSMQKSWYPDMDEYRPMWQIMQPFQLFAHFFPEFDHYWQLEMDTRFMGHTGDMLSAFHNFSKQQPWKQAYERATWAHMPQFHGDYANFSSTLNETMKGGANIWGPVDIGGDVIPIGPQPPTPDPRDEDFSWGVGEDADLVIASPIQDVLRSEDWMFKKWHYGFRMEEDLPRWMSAPAQGRASWNLLNSIHHAQAMQGLRIASEATLPSFALWHGLKIVSLPLPNFQDPERDREELNFVLNGGDIDAFSDGIAMGGATYRGASVGFFTGRRTWDWTSPLPDLIMEYWKGEKAVDKKMPKMLTQWQGEILAPNMLMHPRKTNNYKSTELRK